MTESSYPITGQDFTSDEWSQIETALGIGVLDDWGTPYALTLNDTDQTATIGVSTVSGVARAVVAGFGHHIDAPVVLSLPTVTTPTVYNIGLLYDPTNQAAAAGPVALTVLTGLSPTLTGGKVFCSLYTVSRTSTTALSASPTVQTLTRIRPQVSFDTEAQMRATTIQRFLLNTTAYCRNTQRQFVADTAGWVPAAPGLVGYTDLGSTSQWENTVDTEGETVVQVFPNHLYRVAVQWQGGQVTAAGTPSLDITASGVSIARMTRGVNFTVGEVNPPLSNWGVYTSTTAKSVTFGVTGSTTGSGAYRTSSGSITVEDMGLIPS